jgi:hypothetical protein
MFRSLFQDHLQGSFFALSAYHASAARFVIWRSVQPKRAAHTTVSTASGIFHTVTAIYHYHGRVGTGLSVLWVAYATHSTLKPIAVTVWQIPDAVDTVVCAPDDGWKYHPKRVEQYPDKNKLCYVAYSWIYIGILYGAHPILHISRIRVNISQLHSLKELNSLLLP